MFTWIEEYLCASVMGFLLVFVVRDGGRFFLLLNTMWKT